MFIAILGLWACPSPPQEVLADADSTKVAVQEVFDQYITQLKEQNLSNLDRFFSDDARFYWVEDGQIQYPSPESLIASLSHFLPSLERIDLQVSKSKVDVLGGETALLYAEYTQSVRMKNGLSLEMEGAFSIVLIREAGNWKFLVGHSSTQKPRTNP